MTGDRTPTGHRAAWLSFSCFADSNSERTLLMLARSWTAAAKG